MTIIQFNKNSWQGAGETKNTPQGTVSRYSTQTPKYQADTFEFQDYELEDKPGLLERMRSKRPAPTISAQLYDRAECIKCEALMSKNEAEKLIFKAVENDYQDIITPQGNVAYFREDELGRGVMLECDRDGEVFKTTAFSLRSGRVISIRENIPNSNKYVKLNFFNNDDSFIEVTKGTRNKFFGDTPREVFGFQEGNLTYYRNGKKIIIDENGYSSK